MRGNKQITLRVHALVWLALIMLTRIPASAQVEEIYLRGIARTEQGEFRQARIYAEKTLSYDQNNPDYLLIAANACYRSGDLQAAIGYLQKLEAEVPGMGSYLLATIDASENNTSAAIQNLENHLRSPFKLPKHKILLDDAFSSIENSREWRTLWSGDWYTEDEEFLQELDYLTSKQDYLEALELIDAEIKNRADWDALNAARGYVLMKMGQFQGAIQSYGAAISLNSKNPLYYYGRAESYLAQGKYLKAVPDLEKSYRMDPRNLELLSEIGEVYRLIGDFNKAANYQKRYLDLYPDRAEAHFLYGQVNLDSKNYFAALDQFNACLQLDSTDSRFFAARGRAYLETRTYQYALNDFGMALDLDADNSEVWYLRGLARWSINEQDGAINDWQHAARLGSKKAIEKMLELGL